MSEAELLIDRVDHWGVCCQSAVSSIYAVFTSSEVTVSTVSKLNLHTE